jgi:alpha-beta hydrolase superfamily lysophospholipase
MTAGLDLGTHELCDKLSAAGLEVARYDSRGAGSTPYADLLNADVEMLITDAVAAASALTPDDRPLFLIGHSLGALVAMLISIQTRLPVAGLALLAPAGRPLGDVLIDQGDRESARLGMGPDEVESRHAQLEDALRRIRDGEDDEALQDPQLLFGGSSVTLLRELLRVHPSELLPQVSVPVLVCQGSKDIQVSIGADTMRLLEACEGTGVDAVFVLFPNVDHLMMDEPETSTPQRYFTPRPISSAVLDQIIRWIRAVGPNLSL